MDSLLVRLFVQPPFHLSSVFKFAYLCREECSVKVIPDNYWAKTAFGHMQPSVYKIKNVKVCILLEELSFEQVGQKSFHTLMFLPFPHPDNISSPCCLAQNACWTPHPVLYRTHFLAARLWNPPACDGMDKHMAKRTNGRFYWDQHSTQASSCK